ncbi:MAG: CocE/NonD family hydrolase [Solirubrobacteraceae bacterium]|nr:CocE/NonD family hydrolase [Solirubrobacteraceae bacterium]
MRTKRRVAAALTAATFVLAMSGGAANAESYGIHVSRNVPFTLTDGRTLRADIHAPVDRATGRPAAGPFPVIVAFTPYGKTLAAGLNGLDGMNVDLVREGYIGVVIDVPGTGASEGRFDLFDPAEARAGAEAVRWAAKVPRSNGKVGMLGLSYLAIDQLFAAAEVGPGSPLKAIFPMAATIDPYRDLFVSGGALNVISPLGLLLGYGGTRSLTPFLEQSMNLPRAIQLARANVQQFSRFETVIAHDMLSNGPRRYFNDYWRVRAPETILQKIVDNGVAVYLAGGLYDVFQRGEPTLYSGLQNAAAGRPVTAPMVPGQPISGKYHLLTGPWNHTEIGAGIDLTAIQLRWFDRWLKDRDTGIEKTSTPLHVIEPGGRTYDTATYPLAEATLERLYLRGGRRLTADGPGQGERPDRVLYTAINDPCTRSTDQFSAGALGAALDGKRCRDYRRRPESSAGEATYATDPLAAPLQLAGPIGLTLRARSTTTDALFAITVEDVAPDGRAMDVTGGSQLGSARALDTDRSWPGLPGAWIRPYHQLTRAARRPVPRGVSVRYDIEIRPAFATIPAGHRLRLRIATADFPHLVPLADLPNLLGGRYAIEHDAGAPSFLDLSVLGES